MDLLKAPAYVYYDITNYLIIAKVISNIKKKYVCWKNSQMEILQRDIREKKTCLGSGRGYKTIDGNKEEEGKEFSWVDQRPEKST